MPLLSAPTQQQIDQAVQNGLEWMASKQADDGSFTNGDYNEYPLADAATAILAFESKKHFPGGGTQYSSVVEKGLDYIFQFAVIEDIEPQDKGNPDSNGNNKGVSFSSSGWWSYETGMCLMAIIASEKPDTIVSSGPCQGWTYKDVARDVVDFISYFQGEAYGGWRYSVNEEYSDNSVSQWPVFALQMAENWDIKAPNWVKTELGRWVDYIQDPATGASGYAAPDDNPNMAKTGGLLAEMYWLGDNSNTPRAKKAIAYLNNADEWELQKGDSYSMFSIYKGLKLMNVKELSALTVKDWRNDYTQWLVDNQNQDGYWGDDSSPYDKFLNTGWDIVILEGQIFIQTGFNLTVQASPTTLPADGKSTSTITVTVKDLKGNLLKDQNVSLAVTQGSGILPKSTKDNGNGTYTATYTASTKPGIETITATVSNVSNTVNITLTDVGGGTTRTLYIGEATGSPGKDVIVPIGMNDVSTVTGGDMTIIYDKSILTVKEIKTTSLTTNANIQPNTNTPGEIQIAIAGSNPLSGGSGTLIDVVFTVSASAKPGTETPVTFKKAAIYDATPKDIPIITKDGKVKIGQSCVKGDANGDGVINSKDAIIVLRIAAGLTQPTEEQKCSADANGDGVINSKDAIIVLRKSAGLPTGAPAKDINPALVAITIDDISGTAGNRVTVPVKIDKFNAVSGGNFALVYDSSVLRAVEVNSEAGILLSGNITQPGVVRIAFANSESLGSERIANISFNVLTDNVSSLILKNIELYASDTTTLRSKTIDKKFVSPLSRPQQSALLQNFPNPFNPNTWIPFQLKEASEVTIRIYNSAGEIVRQLELGHKPAGLYVSQDRAVFWDGKDRFGMSVASGIYFYNIQAGNFSAVKKLIVLK